MTNAAWNNFPVRWQRPYIVATPVEGGGPLCREARALRKLSSTTDNVAVAELAKIRLRVVDFLARGERAEPSDARGDYGEAKAEIAIATLDLPRTRGPVNVSGLIDVSAKLRAIEALHAEHLAQASATPIAAFATSGDETRDIVVTARLGLTVAGNRGVPLAPVVATILGIIGLILLLFPGTKFVTEVAELWQVSSGVVVAAVWGLFSMALVLCRGPSMIRREWLIDGDGITRVSRLTRWAAIDFVRLAEHGERVDVSFGRRDARPITLRFSAFAMCPSAWRIALRQFIETTHPHIAMPPDQVERRRSERGCP